MHFSSAWLINSIRTRRHNKYKRWWRWYHSNVLYCM